MYNKDLQEMLEAFQLVAGEDPHVYYQPPDGMKLVYPCFVYSFDNTDVLYSNGKPYLLYDNYTVTYITKKAEPPIINAIRNLSSVRYDRHFTSDNLHHYSFVMSSSLYKPKAEFDLSEAASGFLGGNNNGRNSVGSRQ